MQKGGANALANSEGFDYVEDLIFLMGLLEQVVGDLGVEVVDVMVADVAAEPLKDFGEFEEG